jgi:UDP-sugar pyrophosphorylase
VDLRFAGRNAFDGYTPSVPEGERLDFGSGRFLQLEGQGLEAAGKAAFALVAGGLGERLGYQGKQWMFLSGYVYSCVFWGYFVADRRLVWFSSDV